MKKILFAVAAIATLSLASCGGNKKAAESAALDSDSIVSVVEEEVVGVESISPDSVAVVDAQAVGVEVANAANQAAGAVKNAADKAVQAKDAVKAAASKITQ